MTKKRNRIEIYGFCFSINKIYTINYLYQLNLYICIMKSIFKAIWYRFLFVISTPLFVINCIFAFFILLKNWSLSITQKEFNV